MERAIRFEIVLNGARWANNMITEVLGNHGPALPEDARTALMTATRALGAAINSIRAAQEDEPFIGRG